MDWGRIRSFLWGGFFGGLLGVVLAPRGSRKALNPAFPRPEESHLFSGAPCYREDDQFT
ncbi:MAG TPA: hypothetical protein VFD74_04720 [Thermoleophilia bacterium]|nr:hypothetical protein [Thermoleophilia bacterium]